MTISYAGYRDVLDELRTKINSGEYPPGSELPSENTLIATTRLNRATVRRAIEALKTEGLIDVVRGQRPRVRRRRLIERNPAEGIRREYRMALGLDPRPANTIGLFRALTGTRAEVVVPTTYQVVPADEDLAYAFGGPACGVTKGDPLLVRRYLYLLDDGRPHQLVRSYFRHDMVADTTAADPDQEKPSRGAIDILINELGVSVTRAVIWDSVRNATPADAADLDLALGMAVRATRRILYSGRRPIEVADAVVPGGDLVIRTDVPLGPI